MLVADMGEIRTFLVGKPDEETLGVDNIIIIGPKEKGFQIMD
jgi:hypothetical protein